MSEIQLKLPGMHAGQRRLRSQRRRFNIVSAGRRFGKTLFGLDELICEPGGALEGGKVAWFAPFYKHLLDPWRDCKRIFRPVIKRRGISEQEKRIEFIGGGSIDFWSLSDPDGSRGRKYHKLVVDEAAMVRGLHDAWTLALRPLLTDYRGGAWFFSTPKGANDFKLLYDAADPLVRPDWMRWQMPTRTNPWIDPLELEAARLDLPGLAFAQEYLAQFVDMGGSVVQREWIRYGDPFELYPRDQLVIGMGVDLAISTRELADYTAAVVLARDPKGRRYVIDAARGRMQFNDVLQFIHAMAQKWSPGRIAIESVQYQAAVVQELLRRTELPVYGFDPGTRDKLTRFQPIVPRYQQGLIYHVPGLPAAFEAELLSFPPQSSSEHDDYPDAFTMAWDALGSQDLGQTIASTGDRVTAGTGSIRDDVGFGTVRVKPHQGF